MLLGINQPDAASDIDAYTRGWLYMGSPTNLNGVSYNPDVTGYSKREMVLMRKTLVSDSDYLSDKVGGSLVIWLNKTISSTFSVEIIPV